MLKREEVQFGEGWLGQPSIKLLANDAGWGYKTWLTRSTSWGISTLHIVIRLQSAIMDPSDIKDEARSTTVLLNSKDRCLQFLHDKKQLSEPLDAKDSLLTVDVENQKSMWNLVNDCAKVQTLLASHNWFAEPPSQESPSDEFYVRVVHFANILCTGTPTPKCTRAQVRCGYLQE